MLHWCDALLLDWAVNKITSYPLCRFAEGLCGSRVSLLRGWIGRMNHKRWIFILISELYRPEGTSKSCQAFNQWPGQHNASWSDLKREKSEGGKKISLRWAGISSELTSRRDHRAWTWTEETHAAPVRSPCGRWREKTAHACWASPVKSSCFISHLLRICRASSLSSVNRWMRFSSCLLTASSPASVCVYVWECVRVCVCLCV